MAEAPLKKVDFYHHTLGAAESAAVAEVIESVFLTTGPRTAAFEKAFAARYDAPFAVGVTSWTMGNFLTLKALDIGPGDEVITTPLTFVSTANTVLHAGAKLVLVDVDPATGLMDPAAVAAALTPRTRAILPVHLYGQMVDMKALRDVVAGRAIALIEDCAHCVEGMRDGYKSAALSQAAVFSFYATKNLTCGEGGAIVTRDEALYDKLLRLRLHGMNKSAADRYHATYQHWDMDILGYKANMNDLQAALLLPQLERLDDQLRRRQEIAARYEAAFAAMPGVSFPAPVPHSVNARHLVTIWVDPARRDAVLAGLQARGVGVAVNFRAIHLLTYYRETFGYKRGQFPAAEKIGDSTITLPLYPDLPDEAVDYVIAQVAAVMAEADKG